MQISEFREQLAKKAGGIGGRWIKADFHLHAPGSGDYSTMTTPVELVQKFYAALGTGDIPSILTVLDPDLEWTEAERFPYSGVLGQNRVPPSS